MRIRAIAAAATFGWPRRSGAGQTADELIAKNMAARGGLEKLKAVKTMRLTGKMKVGDDTMPSLLELKRPNMSRWQFTFDGQTAVQAFDGKAGWMWMPFAGMTEPQAMSDPRRSRKPSSRRTSTVRSSTTRPREADRARRPRRQFRPEDWKLKVTLKPARSATCTSTRRPTCRP